MTHASSSGKGAKRERTRRSLIEAAVEIIKEKGFERTSLEEVASKVGMSRGAIYGNFRNREDLFLAVAEAYWEPIAPQLTPGGTLKEQMRLLGQAVAAAAAKRQGHAVGAASFQLYALTHPEMRARIAEGNSKIYLWAEEQLMQFVSADDLPMRPAQFVKVLHALTEGLLSLRFLTPDLITDEVIVSAFVALA